MGLGIVGKRILFGIVAVPLGVIGVLILLFFVSPVVNDSVAASVAEGLTRLPLPGNTQLCDSVSAAGKLNGSGNGMQYFGAILIRSKLSLDKLQEYYAACTLESGVCIVEAQRSEQVSDSIVELEKLYFKKAGDVDDTGGYFIVYAWGGNGMFFDSFDLRGH